MKSGDVSDHVRKIVEKALGRDSPSEDSSNSMTIPLLSPTILFRPNNYRLGIDYKGVPNMSIGTKANHSKLIFWRKGNITVQVGRDKIVGIWNQGRDRQTWMIQRDSLDALESRLNEIKEGIINRIKEVIHEYVTLSNLTLIGDFFWVRHEDWVKGEEYIDKIPKEFTIHDTVFKKVYNDRGIEFLGGKDKPGTVEIKQYIKNRVIEDFAPEIVSELKKISDEREEFNRALKEFKDEAIVPLTKQLKLHLGVEAKQDKNMDKMNILLDKISNSAVLSPNNVEIPQESGLNPLNQGIYPKTYSKYDLERKEKIKRLKEDWW